MRLGLIFATILLVTIVISETAAKQHGKYEGNEKKNDVGESKYSKESVKGEKGLKEHSHSKKRKNSSPGEERSESRVEKQEKRYRPAESQVKSKGKGKQEELAVPKNHEKKHFSKKTAEMDNRKQKHSHVKSRNLETQENDARKMNVNGEGHKVRKGKKTHEKYVQGQKKGKIQRNKNGEAVEGHKQRMDKKFKQQKKDKQKKDESMMENENTVPVEPEVAPEVTNVEKSKDKKNRKKREVQLKPEAEAEAEVNVEQEIEKIVDEENNIEEEELVEAPEVTEDSEQEICQNKGESENNLPEECSEN